MYCLLNEVNKLFKTIISNKKMGKVLTIKNNKKLIKIKIILNNRILLNKVAQINKVM